MSVVRFINVCVSCIFITKLPNSFQPLYQYHFTKKKLNLYLNLIFNLNLNISFQFYLKNKILILIKKIKNLIQI